MHVLIVGFGSIGQRHLRVLRTLLPDARLTVVRTHGPVDLNHPPEGANAITGDFAQALAQKPDAAILAGPAAGRMEFALPLVKAGTHILAEKPIATSLDDIDEVLDTARKNKSVFMVGYVLRYLPVLQAIKAVLDAGTLGCIHGMSAQVGQYLPDWRPGTDYRNGVSAKAALGGGAIFELSHELDYVRWLLGEPTAVTCRSGQSGELEIDVEDSADMIIEFQGNVRASVHLDFLQRPASRTCAILGSAGRLDADLLAGTAHVTDGETGRTRPLDAAILEGRDDTFTLQAKAFLSCMRNGKTPLVSGEDGLAVLKMALAAKQSAATNQIVPL